MNKHKIDIFFFDFVEEYYESKKKIEVITKENWVKQDKTVISPSHPPQETILITTSNTQVTATPYKIPKEYVGIKPVIGQNNFTNQSLHVIRKQLDKIECKINKLPQPKTITKEKLLVNFPSASSSKIALKTNSTSDKIDQMLKGLKRKKNHH